VEALLTAVNLNSVELGIVRGPMAFKAYGTLWQILIDRQALASVMTGNGIDRNPVVFFVRRRIEHFRNRM